MVMFDGEWTTCTAIIGGKSVKLVARADELRTVLEGDAGDVTVKDGRSNEKTYTLRWDPDVGYVEA